MKRTTIWGVAALGAAGVLAGSSWAQSGRSLTQTGQSRSASAPTALRRESVIITGQVDEELAHEREFIIQHVFGGAIPNEAPIDFSVTDATISEAVAALMKAAKLDAEVILDKDTPADRRVTLKLRGVRPSAVLNLLAQSAGGGWRYEMENGKRRIRIGKGVAPGSAFAFQGGALAEVFGGNAELLAREREMLERLRLEIPRIAGLEGQGPAQLLREHAALADKTVEVDFSARPVRDAVKQVLERAKVQVEAMFDEDVPADARVSLKSPSLRLSTVFDVIADSAGVGWRYEHRTGKLAVHFGKTIRRSSPLTTLLGNGDQMRFHFFPEDALRFVPAVPGAPLPSRPLTLAPLLRSLPGDRAVDVDIRDSSLAEAAASVLKSAGLDVEVKVAGDLDEKARVTLKAKGVRASAVLDLIAQAGGGRWSYKPGEPRGVVTIEKGRGPVAAPAVPAVPGAQSATSVTVTPGRAAAARTPVGTTEIRVTGEMVEVRSTFTCPYCKAKSTVVRSREAGTGGGTITTRPSWRFCPMCGKEVMRASEDQDDEEVVAVEVKVIP